jgi:hypothetical protein
MAVIVVAIGDADLGIDFDFETKLEVRDGPLQGLTAQAQVQAFFHRGLRNKQRLEELWASGRAPWKTW